jgi:flagella basal body P-ring formation protein FlgA
MRLLGVFYILIQIAFPLGAFAQELQSLPAIQKAVEDFVRGKTENLPGEYAITVSRVDNRLKLDKCSQMQPYLPTGGRLWGNTSVGVRCVAPTTWSLYVPVQIKVSNRVLVAVRPISSGQQVQADDVELQMRDITRFAGSALTSLDQLAGRTAMSPIPNGTILRAEMLRAANVIRQGQTVQLTARGNGFTVTSEGQAMGNAAAGQVITVKTRSGQLVKGIARGEGVVEVNF